MSAYQTPYECDNAAAFKAACDLAAQKTLTPEYSGCSLHVCAVVEMVRGAPLVVRYKLSDWTDDATVRTYVNGEVR